MLEISHIFEVDYIMVNPTSLDYKKSEITSQKHKLAPVIRIYSTHSDAKIIYVHRFMPFLYVEIPLDFKLTTQEFSLKLKTQFSIIQPDSSIHNVSKVLLTSFYGYNLEKYYFKITYSNPAHCKNLVKIFEEGHLGQTIQVFESHIQYLLQFLIQNNLYGFGNIKFNKYLIRYENINNHDENVDINCNKSPLLKESYLNEFDCDISDLYIDNSSGLAALLAEEQVKNSQFFNNLFSSQRNYKPDLSHFEYLKDMLRSNDVLTQIPLPSNLSFMSDKQVESNNSEIENDEILNHSMIEVEKQISQVNLQESKISIFNEKSILISSQPKPDENFNELDFSIKSDMIYELLNSTQTKSVEDESQNIVEYTKPFFSKYSDWKISTKDISLLPIKLHRFLDRNQSVQKNDEFGNRIIKKGSILLFKADFPKLKSNIDIIPRKSTWTYNFLSQAIHQKNKFISDRLNLTNLSVNSINSFITESETTIYEELKLEIMCMDLFCYTNDHKLPDPNINSLCAIFWKTISDSSEDIYVYLCKNYTKYIPPFFKIKLFEDEKSMINNFIKIIIDINPDILLSYDVNFSWVYFCQRSKILGIEDVCQKISKTTNSIIDNFSTLAKDGSYFLPKSKLVFCWVKDAINIRISGRLIVNMWREVRKRTQQRVFTFEETCKKILKKKFPSFTNEYLSNIWQKSDNYEFNNLLIFFKQKIQSTINIFDQMDLISQMAETCRLTGLPLCGCLSRGSQLHVEALFLRLNKIKGYIAASPFISKRNIMPMNEFIPLVFEPKIPFNSDPVVVLDFQSLYPSIMIAYNYCYSTCIGKISNVLSIARRLGCFDYSLDIDVLKELIENELLSIAPNECIFVNKNVRIGVIPNLLSDILKLRIMVKETCKTTTSKFLLSKLNSRQLSIKMIANVMYGYTNAGFTGHMPCTEIADAILSMARKTLEDSIKIINSNKKWNAHVIYGDTDSVFILLPGVSKASAFKIGREIAQYITDKNPEPVKLKFEKVYLPCFLQTKKRYVGFAYENEDQIEPKFDSKGIETIRRDFCPLASKSLKKCLKVLFETKDISNVKEKFLSIINNIHCGEIKLNDYFQSRIYKGMDFYSNSKNTITQIVQNLVKHDSSREPFIGQRINYVILNGPEKSILSSLVTPSDNFLLDHNLYPNAKYYITKQIIPPLERFMSLINVSSNSWYREVVDLEPYWSNLRTDSENAQSRLTQFYKCSDMNNKRLIKNIHRQTYFERNISMIRKLCEKCCSEYQQPTLFNPVYENCVNNSCHNYTQICAINKLNKKIW